MGLVGGIFSFKWLRSLVGTFTLSLLNFLLGVPLGNEGPCVLMGASLGESVTKALGKKGEVWSRYSITGGIRHSGYLQEGDILRVGCNTYNEDKTKTELLSIVGVNNNE
ncbi:MAG: chloride channel protein [Clostridia bacterium]|nr:chloride channel protein [Clostridia bacterium]